MAIEIPNWVDLPAIVTDEFAPRLGAEAAAIWDSWDTDKRLRVLDVMAVLRRHDIWGFVESLLFGTLVTENHWFWKNDKVTFTPDNGGWWLAVTTSAGVEAALVSAGFENRLNLNHIENQANYMEPGDATVMHWGKLVRPFDRFSTLHFDSGGGKIWNANHFHELMTNTGMTTEEVTRNIGLTPAGDFLRGICPAVDALLP